ncbi:olfactory receptor 5AP2-like [Ambystoma mexicanum]|uniref:olfactory receptor 5AP2-like n=1 Tax=Ambystoma mexicanum TaxID=8296 RepID=UPI0037E9C2AC
MNLTDQFNKEEAFTDHHLSSTNGEATPLKSQAFNLADRFNEDAASADPHPPPINANNDALQPNNHKPKQGTSSKQNHTKKIHCNFINARSMSKHTTKIYDLLCDAGIDIKFVTKTWLDNNYKITLNNCLPEYFKMRPIKQKNQKRGGLAIIHKEQLDIKLEDPLIIDKCESLIIHLAVTPKTNLKFQRSLSAAMKPRNHSAVTEFILAGLTQDPNVQVLLFPLFLLIYIMTLIGNICTLVAICADARLHTPMYYFLGSLSFLDVGYSSVTTPKMLIDFMFRKKTISFLGCVAQLYFFVGFGSTEFFLFAVMAFDRYMAICNPLLYVLTMKKSVCAWLIAVSFAGGFSHSLIHAGCVLLLSFCGNNEIQHFACDYPAFLKLSCTSIAISELTRLTLSSLMMVSSLLVVLLSYTCILVAIARIRTTEGRKRACSTCASHFTCVLLFYGTVIFIYLRPNSSFSVKEDKIVSVFYMVVIPMLNPLIYSLRNQEVKGALKKTFCRTRLSQ